MAADVDDALRPPPGNPRFPLLDSLRAIAALTILVTHVSGVTNFNTDNPLGAYTARLNMGVTIFFLLSGFLLYRPFIAARYAGRPPIGVRAFFRRRVLRIVPAYWVALTVLALTIGLAGMWHHAVRLYLFGQIYWLDSTSEGIFPAWTLCIEVTFYAALPFFAMAVARLVRGRRHPLRIEAAVLCALGLASLALRTALQATGGFYVLQNTLACYLDWFVVGMLVALASVHWRGREADVGVLRLIVRRPWIPWLGAAFVFWVVATQLDLPRGFFLVYTNANYFGEHVGYALVALLLLLPAVFGDWAGGWPRRLLANRVLAWLGLVSYGIFLYHGPWVLWLRKEGVVDWLPSGLLSLLLPSFALGVASAALSYYIVEKPALRFKDPIRRRSARAADRADSAPPPVAQHAER
jgi:peptidoglycan/LPS O-acetylase OafA/YrhL